MQITMFRTGDTERDESLGAPQYSWSLVPPRSTVTRSSVSPTPREVHLQDRAGRVKRTNATPGPPIHDPHLPCLLPLLGVYWSVANPSDASSVSVAINAAADLRPFALMQRLLPRGLQLIQLPRTQQVRLPLHSLLVLHQPCCDRPAQFYLVRLSFCSFFERGDRSRSQKFQVAHRQIHGLVRVPAVRDELRYAPSDDVRSGFAYRARLRVRAEQLVHVRSPDLHLILAPRLLRRFAQ